MSNKDTIYQNIGLFTHLKEARKMLEVLSSKAPSAFPHLTSMYLTQFGHNEGDSPKEVNVTFVFDDTKESRNKWDLISAVNSFIFDTFDATDLPFPCINTNIKYESELAVSGLAKTQTHGVNILEFFHK